MTPQTCGGPDALIPLPSLVVTLLLRNHMPYRSYKSQRANSARSEITDAETDGISRGPTQNVSARLGPKHNFHTPQKAKASGAHAREDRCQNRPHVQRTNTTCSLGKNRCTPSNVFARQEPMHNFHQPYRANTLGAHARRGPMQDTTGAPMTQRPSAVMNHVPATRNIPHGATPRKNEVETPEIQRKTIGGRVGPGRQAKHTRTVTGAQTFVKQNGRNTSNDTSLLTRVPCVS